MKKTTNCPACEQPVSVWRIMSAPTPLHLSCSSCKTKVRPRGWIVPTLIFALVVGIALGLSLTQLYRDDHLPLIGAIAIAVGILVIIEFGLSLLICNKAALEAHSHKFSTIQN